MRLWSPVRSFSRTVMCDLFASCTPNAFPPSSVRESDVFPFFIRARARKFMAFNFLPPPRPHLGAVTRASRLIKINSGLPARERTYAHVCYTAGLLSREAGGIFRSRDRARLYTARSALARPRIFVKDAVKLARARGTRLRSGIRIRLIREGRRKWTRGEPRECASGHSLLDGSLASSRLTGQRDAGER